MISKKKRHYITFAIVNDCMQYVNYSSLPEFTKVLSRSYAISSCFFFLQILLLFIKGIYIKRRIVFFAQFKFLNQLNFHQVF